MTSKYTAAKLAAIARETAVKVGCQAVHWWQEEGDSSRLYIEAKPMLFSHRALLVRLEAVLPQQPENGAKDGQRGKEAALPAKEGHPLTAGKKLLKQGVFLASSKPGTEGQ